MKAVLNSLGLKAINEGTSTGTRFIKSKGEGISSYSPVDGKLLGKVSITGPKEYEQVISAAQAAFTTWRMVPAPKRGEIVRQIGEELRRFKDPLGKLVSYEMGKSLQEGLGEVQEMIDICDFAVGLSRQLYGLTMHSERPLHRMYEQWHPLGITGVISAFNFPVAVWSWNAALAWVCGDRRVSLVWRPGRLVVPGGGRLQGGRVDFGRRACSAGVRHGLNPYGQVGGRGRCPKARPEFARIGRQQCHYCK